MTTTEPGNTPKPTPRPGPPRPGPKPSASPSHPPAPAAAARAQLAEPQSFRDVVDLFEAKRGAFDALLKLGIAEADHACIFFDMHAFID